MIYRFITFTGLILATCVSVHGQQLEQKAIDFKTQVAPIFQEHCVRCHSEANQKGDISLSTEDDLRENDFIDTQDPDSSYLLELITGVSGKQPEMPKESKPLTKSEIATIRQWIADGAKWPDGFVVKEKSKADGSWWAYQPLGSKSNGKSTTNDPDNLTIDDFIRAKLAEQHLQMNAHGDRRTLIRRATYDLTGLPPTPEEVEKFVNDPDPKAYEKLIDRLLASPHYGERWGRHWLDVVRFGESNGFERNVIIDNLWPFRDYVIRSINEDKPFDQFIREHIAGDVIGKGLPDQEIGSAFLVAGPYDNVGNQDPVAAAQIRANTIDEMIRATGESFLGLTMGCSRCHDHKFDPITQQDYYGWYATFAGVRHGARTWATPEERAAHAAQLKPLNERKAALTRQQQELKNSITKRLWATNQKWNRPAVNARQNEDTFSPVKARFVRFSLSHSNQSQPCLDELEIYGPAGKTNLALASNGSRATASSLLPGYAIHQIEHLNDGKHGNAHSWISNQATGWAKIELPESIEVNRVVWGRDRQGKFQDRIAIEYQIAVSLDGKTWKEVANGSDRKPISDEHLARRGQTLKSLPLEKSWTRPPVNRKGTIEKFDPIDAKFVRLLCDAQDINFKAKSGFRIDEFEVYSSRDNPINVALAKNGAKASGAAREIKDFPDAYGPQLAIDGKTGERFIAAGRDLTIELANPTKIDRVVFSSALKESTPEHGKFVFVAEYRIEVSLDGETWREVANGLDRKPKNEAHRKHRIDLATRPTGEEAAQLRQIAQELNSVTREIQSIRPVANRLARQSSTCERIFSRFHRW